MLSTQLLIGSVVVIVTVVFHISALIDLSVFQKKQWGHHHAMNSTMAMVLLSGSVLFILAIHTLEAWLWGGVYMVAGEINQNLIDALLSVQGCY